MSRAAGIGSVFYSAMLFAPLGFWILGIIFAFKFLKTRDFILFKQEVRDMFYYKSQS